MSEESLSRAALKLHRFHRGKIGTLAKVPVRTRRDLNLAYTPGVAAVSGAIAKRRSRVFDYTIKSHTVAVVTDGSAVLGLGNIGPEAALPVMEGKCLLMKSLANVDAFPIALAAQDSDEIVSVVKAIAPVFGAINLEDISAPRCFEIEDRLAAELDIPVFHDDQHGTAIVVLAGLVNAAKVVRKNLPQLRVVLSGAGAAGIATARLMLVAGVRDVILCDRQGTLWRGRPGLAGIKHEIARRTNPRRVRGDLSAAMAGADALIGVSAGNLVTSAMVRTMAARSIVFAMANPIPEIHPVAARAGGAAVIATGRSDFPNQINNVLAFPGVFRGLLLSRVRRVTDAMKLRGAYAIARLVRRPVAGEIMPSVFDRRLVPAVAAAVRSR